MTEAETLVRAELHDARQCLANAQREESALTIAHFKGVIHGLTLGLEYIQADNAREGQR